MIAWFDNQSIQKSEVRQAAKDVVKSEVYSQIYSFIAFGSIYSQKKCIKESFMIVVEANNYVKWFLRYQQFSV